MRVNSLRLDEPMWLLENREMRARIKSSLIMGVASLMFGLQSVGVALAEDTPPPIVTTPPIWTPGMTDDSGRSVPPPLFNPDGTPFENREQLVAEIPQQTIDWYPGMRDASGNEIPAPVYNLDGTPYVEGVSPPPQIPIYSSEDIALGDQTVDSVLSQTIDWYPGMRDRNGNEIPAPSFNPDGSTYIEGQSLRPKIPVYAEAPTPRSLGLQNRITDKSLIRKINSEIKSTDLAIQRTSGSYILVFGNNITALDSSLYLSAVNKKTKKTIRIPIAINSLGKAVALTKVDLKRYNVFIKRGSSTLKQAKIQNNS